MHELNADVLTRLKTSKSQGVIWLLYSTCVMNWSVVDTDEFSMNKTFPLHMEGGD